MIMKNSDTTGRETASPEGRMQKLLAVPRGCGWFRSRIHLKARMLSWPHMVDQCAPPGCPGGSAHILHLHCRTGPYIFIATHGGPVNFESLHQPFDADSWAVLPTTRSGENMAGQFSGLSSLLALGRVCELWLLPPLSQWVIAKVWNWCHNKCWGLGRSFEVRPERRDNVLFPRLSLSHRCF